MSSKIELDESEHLVPVKVVPGLLSTPAAHSSTPVDTSWDLDSADAMVLYLPEEPEIGHEFSYNGVRWRVVDYHDGWVAKLLVD